MIKSFLCIIIIIQTLHAYDYIVKNGIWAIGFSWSKWKLIR